MCEGEIAMPDMNDFHAFKSTSGGSGGGGSLGCPSGCLPWILGTLAILYLIGKIFG